MYRACGLYTHMYTVFHVYLDVDPGTWKWTRFFFLRFVHLDPDLNISIDRRNTVLITERS